MSLPPHRRINAKVEGRDPPETAKETMAPFKALTKRLLMVPMSEVKEQQALYDQTRAETRESGAGRVHKTRKNKSPLSASPLPKKISDFLNKHEE